jgi:hypothetical protein
MLSGVLITEEIGVGNTGSGDSKMVDIKTFGRIFRRVHKTAKSDY